jgi:hypothetical protein
MAWISKPSDTTASTRLREADEFLMRVARHALADHRAIEDIELGKQCGRAVPGIIVGHRPDPTLFIGRGCGRGAGSCDFPPTDRDS